MSYLSHVQWTITPRIAPQPWLACRRCDRLRPFSSSGKVRVNANGKRLDAWLIYRCADCDSTWKRPLLERQSVGDIDPAVLDALQVNDSRGIHRVAFDVADLKRWSDRVEEFAAVHVEKRLLATGTTGATRVEILLAVPMPTCLRIDRLLANELALSRSRVQALQASGLLSVSPHGLRPLRGPVRDGMRVCIDTAAAPAMAQLAGGPVAG
ncbi:MAG TPA: DUF1062 domain-containing protein [Vineibacter sp.]|nr:DUF1062 domain-containing protein [Vineibacter sp.]